jgi:hypothetical protein
VIGVNKMKKSMIVLVVSCMAAMGASSEAAPRINVEIVDIPETPEIATQTEIDGATAEEANFEAQLNARWKKQTSDAVAVQNQMTSARTAAIAAARPAP